MDNVGKQNNPADTGYEMDDELKRIMGKRYEDMSDKFTPEAQRERRNNRLRFTFHISLFCLAIVNSLMWACGQGFVGVGTFLFGLSAAMIVIGYNIGVCVCHNKGWRGA